MTLLMPTHIEPIDKGLAMARRSLLEAQFEREKNKNTETVHCQYCKQKILRTNIASKRPYTRKDGRRHYMYFCAACTERRRNK